MFTGTTYVRYRIMFFLSLIFLGAIGGDFAESVHQISFQTVHPAFYHPVLMES
jgi:hypothetical protein